MSDVKQGRFYVVQDRAPSLARHFVFEPMLFENNERDDMTTAVADVDHVQPDITWPVEDRIRFWNAYLDARTGTYEFRCRRYDAVIDRLRKLGMKRYHSIQDIGAGRMEFGRRLREKDHIGHYIPVDGSIDGTDLNTWEPPDHVDWTVSIEVIEHLADPQRALACMKVASNYGVVVTTPNPAVVDVMSMDPTHCTPVTIGDLGNWGWSHQQLPLFSSSDDTIVGWYDKRKAM